VIGQKVQTCQPDCLDYVELLGFGGGSASLKGQKEKYVRAMSPENARGRKKKKDSMAYLSTPKKTRVKGLVRCHAKCREGNGRVWLSFRPRGRKRGEEGPQRLLRGTQRERKLDEASSSKI